MPGVSAAPGIFTFTIDASDHAGNHASVTHTYVVFKVWGGKLELPPVVNDVAAGSAVPIWFNLGDAAALSAKSATSPKTTPVDCTSLEPAGPTVPASVSPTGTRPSNGRVMYVWKTDKAGRNVLELHARNRRPDDAVPAVLVASRACVCC